MFDVLVIDKDRKLTTRRSFASAGASYRIDRTAYSLDFELSAARNRGLSLSAFRNLHFAQAVPKNTVDVDHFDLTRTIAPHAATRHGNTKACIAANVADGLLRCTKINGSTAQTVEAETWR